MIVGVFPVSLEIPVTLRGDGSQEHADLLQEPGETARPASVHAEYRDHLAHRLLLGGEAEAARIGGAAGRSAVR